MASALTNTAFFTAKEGHSVALGARLLALAGLRAASPAAYATTSTIRTTIPIPGLSTKTGAAAPISMPTCAHPICMRL